MDEMKDLGKYEPGAIEEKWYNFWEEHSVFHDEPGGGKEPYSIVLPPPNVTGQLHMGHALDNTLQDILIRYKRMQGYNVLWLPGKDHAGIATQVKVEKQIAEEGLTKYDLGREKFLERVWEWKEKYGNTIGKQIRRLGSSCDWSRERFTMDDVCARAVREVFVSLYEKGLIYQGFRITNWCPRCQTALSDIEVEHENDMGHLWYFDYPLADEEGAVRIATTRPETIPGDTAVAVNPKDERYAHLVGKKVKLPTTDREIPIIADEYVDMEYGTGCVKITPAHDPNDFALAKKYNLDMPICMNDDGTMNELCHKYQGMDRFECRKQLVADFETAGIVDHIEKHLHQVGHSERSGAIVEPYLSKQWFVKMKPLAEAALANQKKDSKVNFVPERFEKTFTQWMENIEDWCISRQLWWGHQVPAWYHKETGEVYVGKTAPEDIENWTQDEDVLDTWFSSALWPFSTMGWPDTESPDFKRYFPTNTLVTGYDIIFFWVARMIMAGYEYRGKMPFKNVYFTGIVRDKLGRKMSKSLGNSPDPLQLIEQYGADGVRMGLMMAAPAGNDIPFDDALCEQGRNFNNKIWNAFRLIKGWTVDSTIEQPEAAATAVKWFKMQLDKTIAEMDDLFGKYRLSEAMMAVYKLFWDEFSSWYLEMVKPGYQQPVDKSTYLSTLGFFDALLRLLHPFMPFITEELWQALEPRKEGEKIGRAHV